MTLGKANTAATTTLRRLVADIALAAPMVVIVSTVLAAATRSAIAVAVGIIVVIALQIALHRLALRAAQRLRSQALPWWLWATSTISVWIATAGLLSIAIHIGNVDAGFDDSFLIVPAIVVGAVGIAAALASVVLAGRIGIGVLRERGANRDAVTH